MRRPGSWIMQRSWTFCTRRSHALRWTTGWALLPRRAIVPSVMLAGITGWNVVLTSTIAWIPTVGRGWVAPSTVGRPWGPWRTTHSHAIVTTWWRLATGWPTIVSGRTTGMAHWPGRPTFAVVHHVWRRAHGIICTGGRRRPGWTRWRCTGWTTGCLHTGRWTSRRALWRLSRRRWRWLGGCC